MASPTTPQGDFPGWKMLEGAGDGLAVEYEHCSKPGTPKQQFHHMGVTICRQYASERAIKLQATDEWA